MKKVYNQMKKNPKVEICAMNGGQWIRLSAEATELDTDDARQEMLDALPDLKKIYKADDGKMAVIALKDAHAQICSFTAAPEDICF